MQRIRGHLVSSSASLALVCAAIAVGAARGISGIGGAIEAVNEVKVR